MKKYLFLLLLFVSTAAWCEEPEAPSHPQRTPEEIARKQTERLTRELNLTDSVQHVRLYELHLKHVRLRMAGTTRAQDLANLQSFYQELQRILTPAQYDAFMNKQVSPGPRQPQHGAIVGTGHQPRGPQPEGHPGYHPGSEPQGTF